MSFRMIYQYQLQKTLRAIAELKAELAKYESRQTADRLTLCSSESGQATHDLRLDNNKMQGSDIRSGDTVSGQPINTTANQKGGDQTYSI
jgi:hypothetical protein